MSENESPFTQTSWYSAFLMLFVHLDKVTLIPFQCVSCRGVPLHHRLFSSLLTISHIYLQVKYNCSSPGLVAFTLGKVPPYLFIIKFRINVFIANVSPRHLHYFFLFVPPECQQLICN